MFDLRRKPFITTVKNTTNVQLRPIHRPRLFLRPKKRSAGSKLDTAGQSSSFGLEASVEGGASASDGRQHVILSDSQGRAHMNGRVVLPSIEENQRSVSKTRRPSVKHLSRRDSTRRSRLCSQDSSVESLQDATERAGEAASERPSDAVAEPLIEVPAEPHHLGIGVTLWLHRFIYNTRRKSLDNKMSKGVGEDSAVADEPRDKAETDSTASDVKKIVTPHASGMSGVQNHSHVSWSTLRTRLLNAKISEALSNLKYTVNGNEYRTLRCIGSGGYSKVYEVYNENKELFALKVVHMSEVSDGFQEELLKEINFLERFKGSDHVIEMMEYEYRKNEEEHVLLVLMERGECDLSYVLSRLQQKERLTPSKLRFFWEQMLEAVQTIHNENVVHADIKPGNFLLVKGHLKLIDFGLAAVLSPSKQTTERSYIGGTRDYISPESLACYVFEDGVINYSEMRERKCLVTVGYKSDIWALGVILYQLTYGGIAPFSTVPGGKLAKIQATVSPDIPVDFYPVADPHLMDTLNLCLAKDPDKRADVDQLLAHPFLNPF